MDSISETASRNVRKSRREARQPHFVAMCKIGNGWQRIGAAWSFRSGDQGLSVQINALPLNWDGRFSLFTPQELPNEPAEEE